MKESNQSKSIPAVGSSGWLGYATLVMVILNLIISVVAISAYREMKIRISVIEKELQSVANIQLHKQ